MPADEARSTRLNKPYHHGDLRRTLVEVALTMLQEQANADVSLREVARRAGVSPRAPYRHYPDRASLLAGVAALGFERLHAAVAAADQRADPALAIAAQGVAYVRFALRNPGLYRLMFGPQDASSSSERGLASDAAYRVLVDRVAVRYPDEATPASRALGYWSTMHGFALLALDGRVADKGAPERLVRTLLSMFDAGPTDPTRGRRAR